MSSRNSRDLVNPFKKGDTIIVPEGTKFYTNNPDAESPSKTTREQRVEVDAVDGVLGDKMIYEPEITHRTASGYTKRFVLSRAILRANNQPIAYRD